MAIKRPDIYEHNNPNLPIADSDFVKGGIRSAVQSLSDLYALTTKAPQLKQHSTQIYVSGENKIYLLKDINNIGNEDGWEEFNFGGGGGTIENAVYTTGAQTITGPKNFTARPTLSGINLITTGDLVDLELQILGFENIVYTTGNQTINGLKTFEDRLTAPEIRGTGLGGAIRKIDLQEGHLYAGTTTISLNYWNRILSGQWSTNQKLLVNNTEVLLSGEAVTSDGTINTMVKLTQSQYNALSPKDPTTFYVIVG
jgi:hypothetical protein